MLEFQFEGQKGKLTKVIASKYPSLSYSHIRALLRNKEIVVNGKRVKEDVDIERGAVIRLYTDIRDKEDYVYRVSTVYEDDNLFVFFKPKGLETEGDISLLSYAKKLCDSAVAVHRLDVNTDGLIIVAKNQEIADCLTHAIKNRLIEKHYLAAVYGEVKERDRLESYLVKDREKSKVKIFDKPVQGSLKIVTEYERVYSGQGYSIVKIRLVTGRTHQIRAHMAYIGHQVLGDGKYGKREINSKFSYKKQALTAFRLEFNTDGKLDYLKGKVIQIDTDLSVYI